MILPPDIVAAIYAHAQDEYPYECCGAIWQVDGPAGQRWEVMRCTNEANDLHAADPHRFPRDARTAYMISGREVLAINRRLDVAGQRLAFLYHSHPDHDAYFSREDVAMAAPYGEPSYPDTLHLVVSVRQGRAVGHRCFAWDDSARRFVEAGC